MEKTTKELQKPTNFATLFEEKVQEDCKQVEEEAAKKEQEGNVGKVKGVDQNEIRKRNLKELHQHMDAQINNRFSRLRHAAITKDTTKQWDLVAAAVEEAGIIFFNLKERAAKKMRGRSRIAFKNKTRNVLNGIEEEESNAEAATRVEWLRKAAGDHTKLGNKLINVARRMKTAARNKEHTEKNEENANLNKATCEAYEQLASNISKKMQLTEHQKKQMKDKWHKGISNRTKKNSQKQIPIR